MRMVSAENESEIRTLLESISLAHPKVFMSKFPKYESQSSEQNDDLQLLSSYLSKKYPWYSYSRTFYGLSKLNSPRGLLKMEI